MTKFSIEECLTGVGLPEGAATPWNAFCFIICHMPHATCQYMLQYLCAKIYVANMCVYVCMYVCLCVYIYIYIYIHTYIYGLITLQVYQF